MVSERNASSYATITGSRSSHRWWFVKKGNLKYFTNIKSLFLLVHWMAKKNELLSEWKCPEVVVRRCSAKKLSLNILENFQENTCSEVSFYQSYRSRGLLSEFCVNSSDWLHQIGIREFVQLNSIKHCLQKQPFISVLQKSCS